MLFADAITPTMSRYNSTLSDKNSSNDTPSQMHQSNFSTDFKILSLEKQLNIELKASYKRLRIKFDGFVCEEITLTFVRLFFR